MTAIFWKRLKIKSDSIFVLSFAIATSKSKHHSATEAETHVTSKSNNRSRNDSLRQLVFEMSENGSAGHRFGHLPHYPNPCIIPLVINATVLAIVGIITFKQMKVFSSSQDTIYPTYYISALD